MGSPPAFTRNQKRKGVESILGHAQAVPAKDHAGGIGLFKEPLVQLLQGGYVQPRTRRGEPAIGDQFVQTILSARVTEEGIEHDLLRLAGHGQQSTDQGGQGQLAVAPEGARQLGVSRSRRELTSGDVVAQVQQDCLHAVSASCRFFSDITCHMRGASGKSSACLAWRLKFGGWPAADYQTAGPPVLLRESWLSCAWLMPLASTRLPTPSTPPTRPVNVPCRKSPTPPTHRGWDCLGQTQDAPSFETLTPWMQAVSPAAEGSTTSPGVRCGHCRRETDGC